MKNELLQGNEQAQGLKRLSQEQAKELGILSVTGAMASGCDRWVEDNEEHNSDYPLMILRLAELVELPDQQIARAKHTAMEKDAHLVAGYALNIGDRVLAEKAVKKIFYEDQKYPYLYRLGYISQVVKRLDRYITENKYWEDDEKIQLSFLLAEQFPGRASRVLEQGSGGMRDRISLAMAIGDISVVKEYRIQYNQMLAEKPRAVSVYFDKPSIIKMARCLGDQEIVDDIVSQLLENPNNDEGELLNCAYEIGDERIAYQLLNLADLNEYYIGKVAECILNLKISDKKLIDKVRRHAKKDDYVLALLAISESDFDGAVAYIKNEIRKTGLLIPSAKAYIAMARKMIEK
jgi:hypothetical protein